MSFYINYIFREIEYDDTAFIGVFETWGEIDEVYCCFFHDRKTNYTTIWDNNKPINEILPLPIHWLEYKLEKDGTLNKRVSKISY